MIVAIIEQYPEFRTYYEEIYDICWNIEGVMEMFSKELQELDRNTAQLMIDEMQEKLNKKEHELKEALARIRELEEEKKKANQ